jgi:hypothetical protein
VKVQIRKQRADQRHVRAVVIADVHGDRLTDGRPGTDVYLSTREHSPARINRATRVTVDARGAGSLSRCVDHRDLIPDDQPDLQDGQ